MSLDTRSLSNQGSLTLVSGTLHGYDGATITNSGDLTLNSEANWWGPTLNASGGATPELINTSIGTIDKTIGGGTTGIQFAVDNEGVLDAQSGQLNLSGGGSPSTTGSWSAPVTGTSINFSAGNFTLGAGTQATGSVTVSGANVNVPDLHDPTGTVTINNGSLNITSPTTPSNTQGLTLSGGGDLAGVGELDVSGTLSWTGGTMSGSGSTVLGANASGTIDPGNPYGVATLDTRSLTNQGSLTLISGTLKGFNGATITNSGTLALNSEAGNWGPTLNAAGGATPQLINTNGGTIEKSTTGGGTTAIGFAVDNEGTVHAEAGQLSFVGGALPSTAVVASLANPDTYLLDDPTLCPTAPSPENGAWSTGETGNITFGYGCWTLDDSTALAGNIGITGATVQTGALAAPNVDLSVQGGYLDINTGFLDYAPAVIGNVQLDGSGTLSGPGEVDIPGELLWTGGSMSGSGATVISAGGSAQIERGTGAVQLYQRSLVNRGTINWSSGSIQADDDAVIWNANAFYANSDGGELDQDGTNPIVYNTGTISKNSGTATTTIDALLFNQSGASTTYSSGTLQTAGINTDGQPPSGPDTCGQVTNPAGVSAGWINLLNNQLEVVASRVGVGCSGTTAVGDSGTIYATENGSNTTTALASAGAGCSGSTCDVTLGAMLSPGQAGFATDGTQEIYQAEVDFSYPGDTIGPETVDSEPWTFPVNLVAVPTFLPGETWSAYEAELNSAGITTHPREITKSPYLDGPASDVLSVAPAPGTLIDPSDAVIVTTNPNTMPQVSDQVQSLANSLATQNPGITDANKYDVAQSCLDTANDATQVSPALGDPATLCKSLPIFIPGYDVNEAAEHDEQALFTNPEWLKL